MSMDAIQRALDSLTDAGVVDWDALENGAPDDEVREMLHALRGIAAIARAHEAGAPEGWALPFTWGPLEARAYLARGAHGDVYRAWDPRLEREVALKLLRPEPQRDPEAAFAITEGRLLARVRHPNVVAVFGADRINGRAGIWMELVDGLTLREIVAENGPMPADDVIRIALEISDGLAAIHAAGLVHRDIKAQNVVRDVTGRAILMDLSASQDNSDPQVRLEGTPLYLAPEILEGAPAAITSDIYAVGVLLFFLVTGRYPVTGESIEDLRRIHRLGRGERLSADTRLPLSLAAVVDRAISRDSARRFQSAAALRAALEGAQTSAAPRFSRRGIAVAGALAALVLTGVALIRLPVGRSERFQPDTFVVGRHTRVTWDAGLEIDPEISPGGRFVAYSAGQPGYMRVLVREISSGRTVQLTGRPMGDERRPRWSPDGKRVLFTVGDALYTVTPEGGASPTTVISAADIRSAAWDPDGRTILFLAGNDLFRVDPAGGTPRSLRPIEPDTAELSVSPDGSRIAYIAGNLSFSIGTISFGNIGPRVLRISRIDGAASITLTDERRTSASPVWSADGRSLFFIYDSDGRRDVHVVDVNATGTPGRPRRITSGLDPMTVSLSSDGRQLAYSSFTRQSNVWSVEIPSKGMADISRAVPLTFGSQTIEDPVPSPDGRWLYFPSDRHGNSDLFRLRIGQLDGERLTSHPSDEFITDVSPDGREIAFHAFRNGRREVFVMPAEGGPATFVAPGLAANWSPDGSQLLIADIVIRERIGATHRVHTRTSDGRWGAGRSLGSQSCTHMEWRTRVDGFIGLCAGALVLREPDGTTLRTLYVPRSSGDPAPTSLAVAPGDAVYFKSHDDQGRAAFWSVSLEDGAPRLLLRVDDLSRLPNRPSFRADGRSLYITLEERQGDVWVASLRPGGT